MLLAMAEAPTELLKRVPLFSDLNDRELKQVASSMKERTFDAGQTVDRGGQGRHRLLRDRRRNGEGVASAARTCARSAPGDYFGEIGLIADIDRTATITAESDLRCYGMTSWDFRPLVESNASIAWKMLQVMAQRLKEAEAR